MCPIQRYNFRVFLCKAYGGSRGVALFSHNLDIVQRRVVNFTPKETGLLYPLNMGPGGHQKRSYISENNNLLALLGIEYQNIHAAVWSLLCLRHFLFCSPFSAGFKRHSTSPSETRRHQQRASACSCSSKGLTRQPSTFTHTHFHYIPHIPWSGIIPTLCYVLLQ